MLAAAWISGCAGGGAEVRVTADPSAWVPLHVAVLAPALAPSCIPSAQGLPEGLAPPTAGQARSAIAAALTAALAAGATMLEIREAPEASGTPSSVPREALAREYLEARTVDPATAQAAGAGLGADAVLVIAAIEYGPQADPDASGVSRSVSTTVGTTDLGISSAATHVSVWFGASLRCALVRVSDGAVLWDAAARDRRKRSLIAQTSLESVLATAASALGAAFPWSLAVPPAE